MNELQIVDKREVLGNDFTIYGTADEPLFLAKDVAEWIEHSQADVMIRTVDESEKLTLTMFSSGQNREMWFLTEDGLYEVLMQSRKPIAKEFKKQVKEILRSIRKNGGYISNQDNLTNEQILANAYVLAQKIMAEKDKLLLVQNQQLKEMEPKATYYDKVLQSASLMTTKQVASDYGMTAQKLNNLLHELGVQYKQSGVWLLYSKYLGYGYTQTKTHTYVDSLGREQSKIHTYWTQKGRLFIYDLLKSQGVLPTIEQEEIA